MRRAVPSIALAMLLAPQVARADHPPGTRFEPAVVVDIDAEGLSSLELLVADFLPPVFPIPEIRLADSDEECIDLIFDEICWNWYEYSLDVFGLDVFITLDQFDIVPETGRLVIDVGVVLEVASASAPGSIDADLEVIDLISLGLACDVWLDPTPIGATIPVQLALVNGPDGLPIIDTTIDPLTVDLDLSGLRITGCALGDILDFIDAVNDFTSSFLSFDIYEIIAGFAEPLVADQINALLPEIEQTLDDALGALAFAETLDLLGAELELELAPSQLDITPQGLRIGLAGSVDPGPTPHPCIEGYGIAGSLDTPGTPWDLGGWPADLGGTAAVQADDDFVNALLFDAWWLGLLCVELSSESSDLDLPIPIDTSLLGLLAGDAFDDLFPEAAPLLITTRPRKPPEAVLDGPHDIDVEIDRLGLDLMADLDGRKSRVVGVEVVADAGIDLDFDGTTGELAVLLDIAEDAIALRVAHNDLRPDASDDIEDGLTGLVGTLVAPLIGGLVGDLAFALPSFEGLGLSELLTVSAGPQGDHLGVSASLGTVPYDNALDGAGGCGGEGCGGCTSGGSTGGLPILLPAALLWWRRRES